MARLVGGVIIVVAGAYGLYRAYQGRPNLPRTPPTPAPSRPTFTWSTQDVQDATAAAFSVISGLKILTEKEVPLQRQYGKNNVIPLEIKDVFYGRFSSSNTQVDDQQLYHIPHSAYDYDFTDYTAGWIRKAVSVVGKYEDDAWLGEQGLRDGSSPGEWAVSYHGPKIQNMVHGPGIYSTPDFKVAEGYATKFTFNEINCECILQNRVNLKNTREVKGEKGIYFVTRNQDDIRPYGVCIKKI